MSRPTNSDIMNAFQSAYPGIDMMGVYCQMTGKQIGLNFETEVLIDSLSGSAEEIADDIAVRLFASMRPSLTWNKLRVSTLDDMRKSNPTDTCAYLMNRLLNSSNFRGDTLAINHDRILLHNWLSKSYDFVEYLLPQLIDIDARLSLIQLESPVTVAGLIAHSKPFDAFDKWIDSQWTRIHQIEKERALETKYFRDGNTLSKQASVSKFWEDKPLTERQIVIREKKQEHSLMLNELIAMLDNAPKNAVAESAHKTVIANLHTPATPEVIARVLPSMAIRGVVSFGKKNRI